MLQLTSSGRSLMYSRKSVQPRMGPWGTPVLTWYSCEDFSSRTTQSHLILRKEEIRSNIWFEIPWYLSLWRRPACQTLSKALGISGATPRVAPDLVKVFNNSIGHNCLKISKWSGRPKTILEIRKKPYFSRSSTILLFSSFSKTTKNSKKANSSVVFSSRPFLNICNYRDNRWDLATIWKTRLFQIYWRVCLVYLKVQAHSSIEPPLEYSRNKTNSMSQGLLWPF